MMRRLLIVSAALGVTAAAHAQYSDPKTYLGGSVGIYMPTNSMIRDRLGNSTVTFGLGNVGDLPNEAKRIASDFDFITASKDGNRLFVGSLTFGYTRRLGSSLYKTTVPYVKLFAGPSYFDYAVDTTGGRLSGKKIGLNYGAEAGLLFVNRVKLSARYMGLSEQKGLDFSGFILSATVNILGL